MSDAAILIGGISLLVAIIGLFLSKRSSDTASRERRLIINAIEKPAPPRVKTALQSAPHSSSMAYEEESYKLKSMLHGCIIGFITTIGAFFFMSYSNDGSLE